MIITPLSITENLVGLKEIPGQKDHPFIVWCLSTVGFPEAHDELAWCSALVNGIAKLCGLPRSKSAVARSWLLVGTSVMNIEDAIPGFDIVILKRGGDDQPGPEVIDAQGHVGFFDGFEEDKVWIVGGNQSDAVNRASFPRDRILGIRRLYELDT
jgi:uncharacterized protein (TIGR02594 family)